MSFFKQKTITMLVTFTVGIMIFRKLFSLLQIQEVSCFKRGTIQVYRFTDVDRNK